MSSEMLYDLSERDLLLLDQEVEHRKKRVATTWLLWFFLGHIGAHYLYLERWMAGFIRLFGLVITFVASISSYATLTPTLGKETGYTTAGLVFILVLGIWGIWWLIDIYLISGMLRDNERKVQEEVFQEIRVMRSGGQTSYAQPVQGQMQYNQPMQGQPPYSQPAQGYYAPPQQGMGTMPPELFRCQNCGNGIAYGTNPCPYCRVLNRW
jgi:hypothetical protein